MNVISHITIIPNHMHNEIERTHKHIHALKIDCEGCEYDVLKSSRRIKDIDIIVAEFHINSHLRREGHSFENLKEFLTTQNPNIIIQSVDINMHEAR